MAMKIKLANPHAFGFMRNFFLPFFIINLYAIACGMWEVYGFLKENVDGLFCFLMYWKLSMVHEMCKTDDQRDRRHLA